MFHPYPDRSAMFSASLYFAPVLRGRVPDDLNKSINAGYTVAGFLLGETFPVADGATAQAAGVMTREQAADTLEHFASGAITAAAFPWQMLLPIVQEALMELIRRRREQRQPA